MENKKSVFETLFEINVNKQVEKKNGLNYLSWTYAWSEVKKLYPTANYTVYETENGCIYHTDGRTCWVKTGVTIENLEHIEYLPVMDYKNKSISLENITSFDVNKTIQRSLTKALARHGLGLYIYAGEDLPEAEIEKITPKEAKILKNIIFDMDEPEKLYQGILRKYNIKDFKELTIKQRFEILQGLNSRKGSRKVTIKFKVLGEPKGKQRPRLCVIRGLSVVYTPKQTTEYEQKIRASYKRLISENFPRGVPLKVNITALFSIPKKFNKEQRQKALNGEIFPIKKPDGDNIIKIILDALNDTAYFDDCEICSISFAKKYGEMPQIIVEIKEIKIWEK